MNNLKRLLNLFIPPALLLALLLAVFLAASGGVSGQAGLRAGSTTIQTLIEAADGGGQFGGAVALDGDLLAVGARYADVDGATAGAVYLFQRDAQAPNGWTQIHKLHSDPPHDIGGFGEAVALQGDTLVVGASFDPGNGGNLQGAVYVYERNQGGPDAWGLVAQLADEEQDDGRWFGDAVAIDDDLVAVGASGVDAYQGKVYLYSRAAGWARVAAFGDPDGERFDFFGSALALQGDTLVIGSRAADADATSGDTGAVFVYQRNQGGSDAWGLVTRLVAEVPQEDSSFGYALALDGDTLVVAAYNEDRYEAGQVVAGSVGAAYIFGRNQGGADAWGPVTSLRPADGATLDRFGSSLDLLGDDLWVGMPGADTGGFGDEGEVLHYRRHAGGSEAWGLIRAVAPFDNPRDAQFGGSLVAGDTTLLVGAPDRAESGGAVYEIVEVDDPQPVLSAAFLPLLMRQYFPPTGTLVDGGSLEEPNGAIIGAVPGTLSAPLNATIATTRPPSTSLPGGFQPRGDYYHLAADPLVIAPADKPLLVGLPVPDSADPTRLAVAALVPDSTMSEQDEPDSSSRSWTTLPGSYDAATGLFVATLRSLLPEGITVVLFEHPDNQPLPPPPAAARIAQQGTAEYQVACDPAAQDDTVCDPAYYLLIADELEEAHHEFVDIHRFRKPALVHVIGSFNGPDKEPALVETYYGAQIATAPCTNASGQPIAGQYSYLTLYLLVCFAESDSMDSIQATVRHELFHAIQASYPELADDYLKRDTNALSHWLLEGTAAAAEKSGFLMLRSPDWNIRPATLPLTSTDALREYETQDFWVFTGLEGEQSDHYLSYLQPIFDQGATPEHVDQAATIDLGEAYWEWAKNQVFEHYQPMIAAFDSGPCQVEQAALDPVPIQVLPYPTTYYVEGQLPPLTSILVEVQVAVDRSLMPVGAATTGDPLDLRYKVYEEYEDGETGCKEIADGARILQNVPAGASIYVLVTNVSLADALTYAVEVD